jgi:CRISPR-associated protein Cas1
MPVLYIEEQGSIVRKRGERVIVQKKGELLLDLPLRNVESVSVFGNVQVTTQALSELLDRGIPVAIYTRHGRLKGTVVPECSKAMPLRIAQYRAALDPARALEFARALVRAKLAGAAAVVRDYRRNYPDEEFGLVLDELCDGAERAMEAATHAELLGMEGAGAASYFRAFSLMNRSELPFATRERHPAPDPINALLSLGYTFVMKEIRSAVEGAGLEPHLGFLHQVDYGRPSLALDLMEPFRAVLVDRLVLRLVNERILQAEDFARRVSGPLSGSVILMPESFRRFVAKYEEAMSCPRAGAPEGMRSEVRNQTERLAAALRDGTRFEPYLEASACCT